MNITQQLFPLKILQTMVKIMYLINYRLLKSSKLIIDHLVIGNLERNFDLGATIGCNNMFCFTKWSNKYMFPMFCLKFNRFLNPNHQVRTFQN